MSYAGSTRKGDEFTALQRVAPASARCCFHVNTKIPAGQLFIFGFHRYNDFAEHTDHSRTGDESPIRQST